MPLAYYVLSGLLNLLSSCAIAFFLFVKARSVRPSKIFAFFATSVAFWSLFYFLSLHATEAGLAEFYFRTCMIGVVFMPSLFAHFVMAFLHRRISTWFLVLNYVISGLFAATTHTRLFMHGVSQHLVFPYWGIPGTVFPLHLLHFGLIAVYTHYLMFQAIRQNQGVFRNQVLYVFLGTAIGFVSGGTNYFSWYRIPIPPILNPLISLYVVLVALALTKYRLSFVIALTRGSIFGLVYLLVLGTPFALATWLRAGLEAWFGGKWWTVPLVSMAVLGTTSPFIYFFFQRKAESRLLREQRQYQTTLMNAARGMVQVRDLKRLLNLIIHLLTRAMKLTGAGIFLLDEKTGNYVLQASRDRDVLKAGLTLDQGDALITWLTEHQESLVYEEIKQWSASQSNGTVSPATLGASLRRIEASVVVPSFANKTLLGLLVLGEKSTGQMYSQDDLNVLQTLANQAALAIQNAQFYEELQNTTAQLIHNSKLTAMGKMASGMSHQIHNRLYVLTVEAGMMREDLLQRLRAPMLPEAERQALLDKLDASLRSIEEESVKGSTIVKTLLQFSKPTTDMKLVSLQEVVQGGLTMVSLKRNLKQLTLRVELPDDLPRIKVNVPQVQDAFFNLVDNAYDAIDQKAERIRLGLFHAPGSSQAYQGEITIRAEMSEDQRKVLVTVSDNGMGMMAEEQDRLFLPFYTTKATAEKGSGLGLFVIREILKAHGGAIRLQRSEYGKGTAFLVELPLPDPAPSA